MSCVFHSLTVFFILRRLLNFQLLLLKCAIKVQSALPNLNIFRNGPLLSDVPSSNPNLENCLNSHKIFTVAFSSQILHDTHGYNTFSDDQVTLFKNFNDNSDSASNESSLQLKLRINDSEYSLFSNYSNDSKRD